MIPSEVIERWRDIHSYAGSRFTVEPKLSSRYNASLATTGAPLWSGSTLATAGRRTAGQDGIEVAGVFTAKVPGFGLVDWTASQVADYAARIGQLHVTRRRSRLVVLFGGGTDCAACGEPWPCPAAVWAAPYGRPSEPRPDSEPARN